MNGSSDMEGIVELCYSGVWTTISDNYGNHSLWDYDNAQVVCRQLGFHDKCKYQRQQPLLLLYTHNITTVCVVYM